MVLKYDFYKTKYGKELLIDLIKLENLEKYINQKEPHYLTYFDITIITEGAGGLIIDEINCPIRKNTIVFSSPGQTRNWLSTSTPKGFALIFEEEFLCSFFNDSKFIRKLAYFQNNVSNPCLKIALEEFSFLKNLLDSIGNEIQSEITNENHMLRALLYQILIWLDRRYKSANKQPQRITNNYTSEFIDLVNVNYLANRAVNYYAEKLNITPAYLNDLVKNNLKITAKQFIHKRVISEVKRLLRYSEMSISEIAWKLNYQDLSYFIRFFKKETGLTPLQFRKKNP